MVRPDVTTDGLHRRDWIFIGVALVVIAILAPHAVAVVAATRHEYPWDGKVDWFAAQGWWKGVDPYSPEQLRIIKLDGLGHPPTTPFWFLPLAALEIHRMSFTLARVVVALLVVHLTLLAIALDAPRHWLVRAVGVLAGTVVVLSTPWMPYHLNLAQLSELIAFFIVAGWFFVRRGDDVLGGVALGLACTLKFFPGLLVACLLLSKRFRAVAAATLTWLAVNAIMLSRYGVRSWIEFFHGNRILTEYWIGSQRNGSIFGIVLRLFVPSCRGASQSLAPASAISIAIAVVTIAFFWWLSRARWRDNATIDVPYALFAVAGYFFNPWIWEHYNALLIFPCALAGAILWRGRVTASEPPMSPRARGFGVAVLATVIGILLFLPLGYCALLHDSFKGHPAIHFAMHLAEVANWISPVLMMALFAVMLWPLRRVSAAGAFDDRRR